LQPAAASRSFFRLRARGDECLGGVVTVE